jgi:hypothetical protein
MDAVKALRKAVAKAKGIESGTVVKFKVKYGSGDTIYKFAAISVGNGRWASTGTRGALGGYIAEATLLRWFAEGEVTEYDFTISDVEIAVGWEALNA